MSININSLFSLCNFAFSSFHFLYFLWQAQNSEKNCFESKFYLILNLTLSAARGSPPWLDFPGPACSSSLPSDYRFILQTERTVKLPGTGLWGSAQLSQLLGLGKPNSGQEPNSGMTTQKGLWKLGTLSTSIISNVNRAKNPNCRGSHAYNFPMIPCQKEQMTVTNLSVKNKWTIWTKWLIWVFPFSGELHLQMQEKQNRLSLAFHVHQARINDGMPDSV